MKLVKPKNANGTFKNEETWNYTWYVRDAQGNVMATYEQTLEHLSGSKYAERLQVNEWNMYGANRLGICKPKGNETVYTGGVFDSEGVNADGSYKRGNMYIRDYPIGIGIGIGGGLQPKNKGALKTYTAGLKQYELTNHLGNVMAVVSDKKIVKELVQGPFVSLAYDVDVLSSTDYYPGGSILPGRNFSSNEYRYGYQGSEKDDEILGAGNLYTTQFRELDTRLLRWWGVDPKASSMPWQSPYLSMDGNPIRWTDVFGAEVDKTSSGYKEAKNRATELIPKGSKGKLKKNKDYEPEFAKMFNEWDNNDDILVQFEEGKVVVGGKERGGTIDYRGIGGANNDQKVYGVLFNSSMTEKLGANPIFEESYHLKEALEGVELGFDKPGNGNPGLDIYDEIRAKRWVNNNIKSVKDFYSLGNGYKGYTHYGYVKKLTDTEVLKSTLINGASLLPPIMVLDGTSSGESISNGNAPGDYAPSAFGGGYSTMSPVPLYPEKK
jgi:RHS repeat-associated protein